MLNEFQIVLLIAVLAMAVVAVYFIARIRSDSRIPDSQPDKQEIPETAVEPKTEPVYEPQEVKPEIPAEPLIESANRRKCDRIIPKRAVLEHENITKDRFSEFSGERILVAEDNVINQKVILGLLAESGIEIVMANDGQEALDILELDSNFLMILMDAHMPRVDGFEATRIIRTNPKYDNILVVALSGDTASDDIHKMKQAGMDEQLAKPLRMDALYKIFYAYSNKEADDNEVISAAPATRNLDIAKGVEICGGDENFYREILSEFVSNYADSSERLGQFLRSHDFEGADRLLLDIIGISENIGAHPLHEAASSLKMALKDTDERSYFTYYDHYKTGLDRALKEIREYL